MDLKFERGDPDRPRGHAVVYFRDASNRDAVAATYVIVLPVAVDLAKYVPPFLAGQVPNLGEAGLSAFAFPPAPEPAGSFDAIAGLADARDDDLIFAGVFALSEVTGLLAAIGEIVEEYSMRYEATVGSTGVSGESTAGGEAAKTEQGGGGGVDDVVYGLMSEPDRLGELTKLLGRLRFAAEGDDTATVEAAGARIKALAGHMPANRHINRLLAAATDRSPNGAPLAQLYLERAYCLSREDYLRVKGLDEEIAALQTAPD